MDQYISMISDRKIFHLKIALTHIYFPFLPFIIMKITIGAPNGSGKSTILKSITKQLTLIGGKVTIGEKNLKDL